MSWSWMARAFAFAKVYRSRTHRPDWLKRKEVAQFFNSGWLTFLLTFTTMGGNESEGHEGWAWSATIAPQGSLSRSHYIVSISLHSVVKRPESLDCRIFQCRVLPCTAK